MPECWENRPYLINVPFTGIAGMEVRDLPTKGRLSAVVFECTWDNLVGGDNTLNLADLMTLIEIIHRGSEVIKSLTGIQHMGVAWRRGCGQPENWMMALSAGTQRVQIVIPFGRYPYDREYGLTLDNLVNPQIRFTWNNAYAASNDAAGGFAAALGNWSIRLIYAPDVIRYKGYIKTSRIDQFPVAANTRHYTEMPKHYKWPRIYIQEECADFNLMFNTDEYVLEADNRAWVPVTLDQWGLQRLDTSEFGRPELWRYFQFLNQVTLDTYSLFDETWESMMETQGGVGATCQNCAQGVFDPTIMCITTAVTVEGKLMERGKGFGRMYAIPLCPPNQEAEIASQSLDSKKWGRLMLEIMGAPAIGTTPMATVILEELLEGM